MADFYKYNDNPTVYNSQTNEAYASPDAFFAAGGAKDFSNVTTLSQPRPAVNPQLPVNAGSINTPPTQQPASTPGSNVNAFVSSFQDLRAATSSPALTTAETERAGYEKQLKDNATLLEGKSTRIAQEEDKQGVNTMSKELSDLNSLIAQRTGEYNKAYIAQEGQAIPIEFITGRQAQIQRSQAIEIGALEAKRAALTGNIELAKSLAERTVNLEYEPIEQKIKNAQAFLELNSDTLNREEKKQAETLNYALQQQEKQIAKEKEAKTFAISNNITSPYYELNGTVYRTSDGKAYSTPEQFAQDGGSFDKVQKVNPQAEDERKIVAQLSYKYSDAGISLSDTLATAQQKLQKSRIFAQETRLADGSDGSSTSIAELGALGTLQTEVDALNTGQKSINQVPEAMRGFISATQVLDQSPYSPTYLQYKTVYKYNKPTAKQLTALNKAISAEKYPDETAARAQYDKEIQDLQNNPQLKTAGKDTIIKLLVDEYGARISKEEITATVNNIIK